MSSQPSPMLLHTESTVRALSAMVPTPEDFEVLSVTQRARMLIKSRDIMAKRDGHTVPVFRTSSAKIRPRQR